MKKQPVKDSQKESHRVSRGGCFNFSEGIAQVYGRIDYKASARVYHYSFRIVRNKEQK